MTSKKEDAANDPKKQDNANEKDTPKEDAVIETKAVKQIAAEEIDSVIRNRVYVAMGLGLAPIALVDLVGLTAIQIDLVRALAKKYDVPFKQNAAKTIISALVGSILPVGAAPVFASIIKMVPFIGYTTGAVSISLLGGAATYAVGKVFNKHFASGGTLLDVDTANAQKSFKEQFEKGKSYVSSLKKKKESDPKTNVPAKEAQTPETKTA